MLQAIGNSPALHSAAVYCTDSVVKPLGKTSEHQQGWVPENFLSFAKIMFGAFYQQGGRLAASRREKKLVNSVLHCAKQYLQQNIHLKFEQKGPENPGVASAG